ncbi:MULTISPECIES: hypothetical protein [unclassified Streptomyces]|uniref:hypothetical protein n=1 Tax=unclassified Streptomyces TaxID=2593676 RepID=UPI002253049F|nr:MULTISPECIES: hypothetical protein [unclassified Streptomyces]MCX5055998.1 hypothetical protein [Streptomyces sp. NBC_00452]MCX5287102.1 hypothetical protein [Streptomyces sp. NBC_00183]
MTVMISTVTKIHGQNVIAAATVSVFHHLPLALGVEVQRALGLLVFDRTGRRPPGALIRPPERHPIRRPRTHPLAHRSGSGSKTKQRLTRPKPTQALHSRSEGMPPSPAP